LAAGVTGFSGVFSNALMMFLFETGGILFDISIVYGSLSFLNIINSIPQIRNPVK
jgi:hypothetical protein